MAVYQGNLYIAGNFEGLNGHKEIVYWDGTQWKPLVTGILGDSWVNCMTVYKDELYIGGYFFKADVFMVSDVKKYIP